jgi:hypothetical protein
VGLRRAAAIIYAVTSAGVIGFQLALAAGAPWGSYAMGGAFPGQFPPEMRVAAVVQAALIVGMALVVLSRAGVVLPSWSRVSVWLVWVVVALGLASFAMNLATPSVGERMIWAPIAFILFACSAAVAIGSRAPAVNERCV